MSEVPTPTDATGQVAHFWVCAYPSVESSLYLVSDPEQSRSANFTFFDCDGAVINETQVSFQDSGEVGVIELDQFLGAAKLESGLKYAHLMVASAPGTKVFCRMHTKDGACFLNDSNSLSLNRSTFFPVTLGEDRTPLLALVNQTVTEARVKVRLYAGTRTPEMAVALPPRGARIINLVTEFADHVAPRGDRAVPGYLRLSTKASAIGANMLDRIVTQGELGREHGFFIAVT